MIGISCDNQNDQKAFRDKFNLNFPMLCDDGMAVGRTYGTVSDSPYAARSTFLIDKEGIVRKIFENVNPTTHAAEVLQALDELQEGKEV